MMGDGGLGDLDGGMGGYGGPRPIREVIPEFPESERKKGVHGVVELKILVNASGRVDSVMVLNNTTGSKILARSAKAAAYRSIYRPVKNKKQALAKWVVRPYRFDSN